MYHMPIREAPAASYYDPAAIEARAAVDREATAVPPEPTPRATHYRNGREAKNGDIVVAIRDDGSINQVGVLYDLTPAGGNYAKIAPLTIKSTTNVCTNYILHMDDVAALLKQKQVDAS